MLSLQARHPVRVVIDIGAAASDKGGARGDQNEISLQRHISPAQREVFEAQNWARIWHFSTAAWPHIAALI